MTDRDWTEPVSITLPRRDWFDITGVLGNDMFEGEYTDLYDTIYNQAFPEND